MSGGKLAKTASRDDSIAAARVPAELKEQVAAILDSIGATPTQLINSAYQYVLEFKRLPLDASSAKQGRREVTPGLASDIHAQLQQLQVCDYDYSEGSTKTLKAVLAEKRRREYQDKG
jgi:antitoxin component of RelBE/YafQ-DinJ toxin-antitoxin module